MIIEISDDNSIVKWKMNDYEWKTAEISDLIKAYMGRPSGEWIKHIDDLFPEDSFEECPFCHEEQRLVGNDDNFCPNCGAKLKMPY